MCQPRSNQRGNLPRHLSKSPPSTTSSFSQLFLFLSPFSSFASRSSSRFTLQASFLMILSEHDTKQHVRRSPWRRYSRSSHGSSLGMSSDYAFFENNNHNNISNKNINTIKSDDNTATVSGSSSGNSSKVNLAAHLSYDSSNSGVGSTGSSGTSTSRTPAPSSSSSSPQRRSTQMLRRSLSWIRSFSLN
ncbi:hypothetical protein HDK64DRAFT_65422 [Phyllosticta capitalensis]